MKNRIEKPIERNEQKLQSRVFSFLEKLTAYTVVRYAKDVWKKIEELL